MHWFSPLLYLWHYLTFAFVTLFFGRWNNADRPQSNPRCGSDGPGGFALTVSGQYSQEKRVSSSWCPFWCRLCSDLTCLALSPGVLCVHMKIVSWTGQGNKFVKPIPNLRLTFLVIRNPLRFGLVDNRLGFFGCTSYTVQWWRMYESSTNTPVFREPARHWVRVWNARPASNHSAYTHAPNQSRCRRRD